MQKLSQKFAAVVTTAALVITMAPLAFAGSTEGVPRTLSVTGEGKVSVQADHATISLTIENTDASARTARQKNMAVFGQLKDALASFGLGKDDIKVDYYSGYPNFQYNEDNSRKMTSYTASYSVTVQVKDLTKISDMLDKIADFENVNLMGTNYLLDNNESAVDQAREKAAADAQKKASKLAKAFNSTLGAVTSLYESSYTNIGYGATGMQSTNVDVTVSLSVGYEIK